MPFLSGDKIIEKARPVLQLANSIECRDILVSLCDSWDFSIVTTEVDELGADWTIDHIGVN